jgi:hypothetical protein
MSIPINTPGLLGNINTSQPSPSSAQAPQPSTPTPPPSAPLPPLAPGQITRDPNTLRQWDTARPILRFDFRTPEEQATFHRAFAQIRTEKQKTEFMTRFFNNYDAQVQIPRRVMMDTSRDEAMAREVQERMGLVIETGRDEEMARRMQGNLPPVLDTARDEAIARRLAGRTPVPRTVRDEEMARRLQQRDEARRANAALNDEAIARRMQQQMDRENQARGHGGRTVDHMADRFGGMSFGPQRGPSGYERRRPQGYGQGGQQGYGGGNDYNTNSPYGGDREYGPPRPGQYYDDDDKEEDEDFDQSYGGGMGRHGPRYGRGGGRY